MKSILIIAVFAILCSSLANAEQRDCSKLGEGFEPDGKGECTKLISSGSFSPGRTEIVVPYYEPKCTCYSTESPEPVPCKCPNRNG